MSHQSGIMKATWGRHHSDASRVRRTVGCTKERIHEEPESSKTGSM